MCSVAPSCGAFGQHEFAVHDVDDLASRQQKMLQQRQLALKRQKQFTKTAFGAGVTAQLDSAFDVAPLSKKTAGWEKMLGSFGIDVSIDCGASCPEKTKFSDPSAFVRIRVPFAEESMPALRGASQPSPTACLSDFATQDVLASTPRSVSENGDQQTSSDIPVPITPRSSEADGSLDGQIGTKTQEKSSRGFKLWRPWGTSKRTNVEVAETIAEEKRVSLALDTAGEGDRSTTLSIGRAATPFQPGQESVLEESFGSDMSSIFGLVDGEDPMEDSLEGIKTILDDNKENELVDGDDDNDSIDSGIDNTLKEWKMDAPCGQSPTSKRSRFNRFIPSVPAPHFWRSSKAEATVAESTVTRIQVTPRAPNPEPLDVD